MRRAVRDVQRERLRQNRKWGEQNHLDGTSTNIYVPLADRERKANDDIALTGHITWKDILQEEVLEAYAEEDPEKLRTELVQVAAVCIAWVEAIDRRTNESNT